MFQIGSPNDGFYKEGSIMWSEEAQNTFEKLNQVMYYFPLLTILDFSLPFTIECDASIIRIGYVLMKKGYPIAFESSKINHIEKTFNIYDK